IFIEGEVRVVERGLDPTKLGRSQRRRRSWWRSLLQPLTNPKTPGARDTRRGYHARFDLAEANALKIMPDVFEVAELLPIREGLFGEQSALARRGRTRTVLSYGPTKLLEVRWQGVRDLRRHDAALMAHLDEKYLRIALMTLLGESPMFSTLTRETRTRIIEAARFETYGRFEWHRAYERDPDDPLRQEQVIAEEGHYPNGLLMILSGFARLTRTHGDGEETLTFRRRGDCYGLEELIHNADSGDQVPLTTSLRAVGYVDVIRIPTRTFEEHMLPVLPPAMRAAAPLEREPERIGGDLPRLIASGARSKVNHEMLEFLGDHRFMNGTATMVIDMDRCTRCDDCVRACASGHLNSPVFVRHGPIFDNFMVANACMQCVDPVCMIDCPTGAIHSDVDTGIVVINEKTCIGCEACANSCPYDNIRMIEIRDKQKDEKMMVARETGRPILKATKCDLCVDHHGGPACQRACPHDALTRLDMQDLDGLAGLMNR
ncbi:MAG: 4Fe-4S dicluster domain-containing protein, partial [Phycisphaerae bacterium]|nr:4Fe-4S dicluster domain-containing protein [Phycisphaerae bacterium]